MRILAIDTSTRTSGVALVDGDRCLGRIEEAGEPARSRRLLPHVLELLADRGMRLADLELIAVAIGPGSFTGLRIGLATAHGLGYALGIPVAGVPTLEAFAWLGREADGGIVPVLEARRGQVYVARFCRGDAIPVRLTPDEAAPVEEAFERVVRPGDLVLGEGAWSHREALSHRQPSIRLLPPVGSAAEAVARLAPGRPGSAAPRYLLPPLSKAPDVESPASL